MIETQDYSVAAKSEVVNRQLLQLVMDNMPECIFSKDIAGRYLGGHQKVAGVAGYGCEPGDESGDKAVMPPTEPVSARQCLPPTTKIAALLKLTQQGSLSKLRQSFSAMVETALQYTAFVTPLLSFAQQFHADEIESLLCASLGASLGAFLGASPGESLVESPSKCVLLEA